MKTVTYALIAILIGLGGSMPTAAHAEGTPLPPGYVCPPGTVPGILNEAGQPTGCINNMPCLSRDLAPIPAVDGRCPAERWMFSFHRVALHHWVMESSGSTDTATVVRRAGVYRVVVDGRHSTRWYGSLADAEHAIVRFLTRNTHV